MTIAIGGPLFVALVLAFAAIAALGFADGLEDTP